MNVEKIITLTDDSYHYIAGYFVTNKWIDNDAFIAVRSESQNIEGGNNELIKVSLNDMSIEVLEKNIKCNEFSAVYGDKVYYSVPEGIMELNLKDNSKRCVCKTDAAAIHLTENGEYASVFKRNDEGISEFYRVNIRTGEIEKVYEKIFRKPLSVANHLMISPTDKDVFFFAHEGETFYVSNRLWLYNAKSGKARNIAKQRLNQNGDLEDCFGHEMWAPDGKGIYFVKYDVSLCDPCGICYVDIESGNYKVLYSKYKYWHVGVSNDDKYLTADTQYAPHQSEVVVIDREAGEEFVVDMPYMTAIHPCHPHPQLSPDNKKIIYTALDKEDGRTCVKIAYIKR